MHVLRENFSDFHIFILFIGFINKHSLFDFLPLRLLPSFLLDFCICTMSSSFFQNEILTN